MIEGSVFLAVLGGILLLLFLILRVKLPAFLALLLASLSIGVFRAYRQRYWLRPWKKVWVPPWDGVAIVVGLGAPLGGLLEHSGGATALATALLRVWRKKPLGRWPVRVLSWPSPSFLMWRLFFGSLGLLSTTQNGAFVAAVCLAITGQFGSHACLYSPNAWAVAGIFCRRPWGGSLLLA